MTSRMVYALVLLPAIVIGITATYGLVSAQARWDAAQYTNAELRDAQAARATAEAARATAQAAHEQLAADYARFRASIGELFRIACR